MEFALIATTSSSSDSFYYNIFFFSSGDAFYLEICFPGIAITTRAAYASRWGVSLLASASIRLPGTLRGTPAVLEGGWLEVEVLLMRPSGLSASAQRPARGRDGTAVWRLSLPPSPWDFAVPPLYTPSLDYLNVSHEDFSEVELIWVTQKITR